MNILGIVGLLSAPDYEKTMIPRAVWHDSAAALVRDGKVCAAIEEERLSRVKHTNRAPYRAMRFCLGHDGLELQELDAIATYFSQDVAVRLLGHSDRGITPHRLLQDVCSKEFGCTVDETRIHFVDHHTCHAWSAVACVSGESALVITLDGTDHAGCSGMVSRFEGTQLHELRRYSDGDRQRTQSLGFMYQEAIRYLGYALFDEYKVMGLAPYGDPERYRSLFTSVIHLEPEGQYWIDLEDFRRRMTTFPSRAPGQPIGQEHNDFAAAVQAALESTVLHVARHFAESTQLRCLALAGGVAQNCSANGKLAMSGLFEQIVIPPAAHDAGCAVGAALQVDQVLSRRPRRATRAVSGYWGRDVAKPETALSGWAPLVACEAKPDIVEATAAVLAAGGIVGWVQGRSEFGPRALGNRSILADPRPAENRTRINAVIKNRESYRPFAPSVIHESCRDYFIVPSSTPELPFMSVTVPVRPEYRDRLAAVTHVDGSARVQTVTRAANEKYWSLLRAFERLTGIGVLLNTSFNTDNEPIVDSVDDAVACYLTTELDVLVIGDVWITRRPDWKDRLGELRIVLPASLRLQCERGFDGSQWVMRRFVREMVAAAERDVSDDTHAILSAADGCRSIDELCDSAGFAPDRRAAVVAEVAEQLWAARLIALRPGRPA